jgi:purine-binding chemotaxis protein CheW
MNDKNINQKDNQELYQLVSFHMDNEEFGVDILKVQEIIKMIPITKVPNAPSYIEGVINLRGRVIPIVNLRLRLNMCKKDYDKNTRIIVIDINHKIFGFIVDSVSEVLRIPRNIIEAPPEIVTGVNSDFITAVGKLEDRLLILLDLEKTFTDSEKSSMEKLAEL